MAVKYKEYVQQMLAQNRKLFEEFQKVHDNYAKDPKTWKSQFNEMGQDVLDIIRRYENMLCSKSQSGGYGKFTTTLADRFHDEVKMHFPKIDSVGLE